MQLKHRDRVSRLNIKGTNIVLVNIFNHILEVHVIKTKFTTSLWQLINGYKATSIFVKKWECWNQVFLPLQLIHVQCSCNEFTIVDGSAVINISLKQMYQKEKSISIDRMCKELWWTSKSKRLEEHLLLPLEPGFRSPLIQSQPFSSHLSAHQML